MSFNVFADIISRPLPLAFPSTITLFKKPSLQELIGDEAVPQVSEPSSPFVAMI